MTLNFLAFGSHANYIEAGNRILNQAKSLDLFDKLNLYNADDLKKDKDFWDRHGEFIQKLLDWCVHNLYRIEQRNAYR